MIHWQIHSFGSPFLSIPTPSKVPAYVSHTHLFHKRKDLKSHLEVQIWDLLMYFLLGQFLDELFLVW